ncbi:hypothetical protein BL253_33045 [Pseudofrankia asymbiotica]|uniref:Secreted protein n=1 Tax=Pseudofrankia asymbiotica TaxID=1834516 RepID=A0A1V2I169_9ACTN|nr:hypothetical protein BL253_33045 [Pseudofrankia asymbiotica]
MGPARGATAWLRARARTTPGLLRIVSVALVAAITLMWAAAFAAVVVRDHAVHAVSADAGPAFAAAQRLHADLSAADATIASAVLAGPVEPPEQRRAYDESIALAEGELRTLARAGGTAEAGDPLDTLHRQIPAYTGLIGQARANNRQGYVVGGAYLQKASQLMQQTILPAADSLAASSAEEVDDRYRRATSSVHVVLVSVAGVVSLAALAAVQVWLFRRTHRRLNLGLLLATACVLVIFAVTLGAFSAERARMLEGRDHGFVPMSEIAQARVLGLRAWGDESLSLIARGDGAALDADADAVAARLGYTPKGDPTGSGVLPAVTAYLSGEGFRGGDLAALWRSYQTTSWTVRSGVKDAGGFNGARELALVDGAAAFKRFDDAAEAALRTSQQRFDDRLSAAGDRLRGLEAVVIVLSVLAAAAVLAGIQPRINEYR